jgi:hypothetical protein
MNFYSFDGRMVFKLKSGGEGDIGFRSGSIPCNKMSEI